MKFKRSVYNIFWLTMISQWLKHLWKGCIMRGMLYFFFSCALFKLKFLRHVTARPPEQMVVPFAISTAPFSTPDPFEVPSGRIWPRQLTFGHPSPSPSLLSPFPISIHLGGWIGALVGGGSLGHWGLCGWVACCRVLAASAAVATCSCPSPFINIRAEIRNVLRLASGRTRPQRHSQDSKAAWSGREPGGPTSSTGTKPST